MVNPSFPRFASVTLLVIVAMVLGTCVTPVRGVEAVYPILADNPTAAPSALDKNVVAAYPALADDPNPPDQPVKLIFIHHSTGEGWLADDNGGLGLALRDANYFVSDTNYGWVGGGTDVGDRTDIGNWWEWFAGPSHNAICASLYAESEQHCSYTRLAQDPGGQNEIVMFKSCFPNSNLSGNPDDPPTTGVNPLRGQACCGDDHNVANAKGIYNDLLPYFASRQDKLFVVITAPPLDSGSTDASAAANARALNRWLMTQWLASYPHHNVAVFDYYNVLTSNAGSPLSNDLGSASGNHHRFRGGAVEWVTNQGGNIAAYSSGGDSHPTSAGQHKATGEFISLLNIFYHRWKGGPVAATPTTTPFATATATSAPATPSRTPSSAPTLTPTPPLTALWAFLPFAVAAAKPAPTVTASATESIAPSPTPSRTPSSGGHEVTIQRDLFGTVRDAYIWETNPDTNGNWENLYTGHYDEGYKKTLLWFDLSFMPTDAAIDEATLWLYQTEGGGEHLVRAYRIAEDWGESEITWNTFGPPDGVEFGHWSAQGTGWKTMSLTTLVQSWATGVPNQGLVLVDADGGAGEFEVYHASEFAEVALRPKLVIRWH